MTLGSIAHIIGPTTAEICNLIERCILRYRKRYLFEDANVCISLDIILNIDVNILKN